MRIKLNINRIVEDSEIRGYYKASINDVYHIAGISIVTNDYIYCFNYMFDRTFFIEIYEVDEVAD